MSVKQTNIASVSVKQTKTVMSLLLKQTSNVIFRVKQTNIISVSVKQANTKVSVINEQTNNVSLSVIQTNNKTNKQNVSVKHTNIVIAY